ncbi:MAG: bifunctional transaldolase/phosoglucose isomerase [Anaerolineaceae bacterium]|nr:bifunctional transaldolase/phosoglucose isomerase [Anaerolineaceae bacterium]
MNNSQSVKELGQSIWYDNIEREMLRDGRMKRMIRGGQIYGVTSNPSIFEAALKNSTAYDDLLQAMAWSGMNGEQIYTQLVKEDIQKAADLFLPVYRDNHGQDGFVSVEINPFYAYDARRSIEEGRSLWKEIDRENLMIKVPATGEGLEVITALIADGINVNTTLIFSLERYEQVIDAYLSGLEQRLARNERIDTIAGAASFFVSRIDVAVDQLLDAVTASTATMALQAKQIKGKIAIASARLAYQVYLRAFSGLRFEMLKERGAHPQKPLWASTGTKNPDYPDTLYVDNLIGFGTINTVPQKTLDAFLERGRVSLSIGENLEQALSDFELLKKIGIDLTAVTQQLETEGVEKFRQAHNSLLEIIEKRRVNFLQGLNGLADLVEPWLTQAAAEAAVRRLYAHDPTLWTDDEHGFDEIRNRLGWLDLPSRQLTLIPELEAFRDEVLADGFTDAFVLGMGGSSLAPEVISQTIAPSVELGKGLRLQIIDTTSPEEILFRCEGVELDKTLFIVSSKSGGTSETLSAMKYFWSELVKLGVEQPGRNFVAVTDPDTSLQHLAESKGFRKVFNARPDVGGRYSVFTRFGLLPAVLMGVDLNRFLSVAIESEDQGREDVAPYANPNLILGLLLGGAARTGKDKLTFIAESYAAHLVPWLEQLIAESSGKEGKGILPVEGEPPYATLAYPPDRLFIHLSVNGERAELVSALKDRGHAVIEIAIRDPYQIAKEFYRWEYATAIACALLKVNAFDQPNVQLSKTITKNRISQYQEKGRLDDGQPLLEDECFTLYGEPVPGLDQSCGLSDVLAAYASLVEENGYIALNAFLPRLNENEAFLQSLRTKLLHQVNKATTLGFGPRFLHSTGQLHKGGLPGGLFITFTQDSLTDLDIPGEGMSFATLQRAQALGDIDALKQKGKRVIRIHLK